MQHHRRILSAGIEDSRAAAFRRNFAQNKDRLCLQTIQVVEYTRLLIFVASHGVRHKYFPLRVTPEHALPQVAQTGINKTDGVTAPISNSVVFASLEVYSPAWVSSNISTERSCSFL